jgi:predicted unusual protein kinase regulating ubiquinone biosynthesis (AarF/ABC1/UbiB family)
MAGLAWDRLVRRGEGIDALAARRARRAFEHLGPTFVKLGQLISSSPGTVSPGWIAELASCRDDVSQVPWPAIDKVIEAELSPESRRLIDIDHQPLAAGSMAQVHAARLSDGTEVVVKVQRPDLERVIRQDLCLLRIAARWVVRIRPSLAALNPTGLVEDFAQSIAQQLSFRTEVANMSEMRHALKGCGVIVPKVWSNLSTDRVVVMEQLFGVGVDDPETLDALGVDRRRVLDSLVRSLLVSALGTGTFHGDLHAGNMLVRPDGRLVLLDFGVVGRMDATARRVVASLLTSIVQSRFDAGALAMLELVDASSVDLTALAADVQTVVAVLAARPLHDINVAEALSRLLHLATVHQLTLPREVVGFLKQLMFLDGICRTLEPNFDLFADGADLLESSLAAA